MIAVLARPLLKGTSTDKMQVKRVMGGPDSTTAELLCRAFIASAQVGS